MSEQTKVDVLAVMDDAAATLAKVAQIQMTERADEMREARAAVAELQRLVLAIDDECSNAKPDFGRVVQLASEAAALARVGAK